MTRFFIAALIVIAIVSTASAVLSARKARELGHREAQARQIAEEATQREAQARKVAEDAVQRAEQEAQQQRKVAADALQKVQTKELAAETVMENTVEPERGELVNER